MATIALAVAGVALAPFTGGLGLALSAATGISGAGLGLAIGAFIDQTFIFPLLEGGKDVRGPRLDDLQVQTASEGSGMKYALGAENRLAGAIIWAPDLIEEKVSKSVSGGKGGGGGAKQENYSYFANVAVAVCEGPVNDIVRIWADSKVIYDDDLGPGHKIDPRADDIRIYSGTNVQTADPLIEANLGAANTPAYRDTCYVVIERLALRDFGNRIPQFTFLVRVQTHESVRACISNLVQRGGFTYPTDYNVDDVDSSIRGYSINGPLSTVQAVEPIMLAYDVLSQETNGKLRFFTRGHESLVLVDADDLVAHEHGNSGSDLPRPFTMTDPSGFDLPKEVNIRYLDPTTDYQSGSQRYVRVDTDSDQVISIDVPVVMSPKDARNLAASQMWRRYLERTPIDFSLPPSYLILEENDKAQFTYNGETYTVRVVQVDRGANFLLNYRAVVVGIADADEVVECGQRMTSAEPASAPQPVAMLAMDAPALTGAHAEMAGVYLAASPAPMQPFFVGVSIYTSTDNVNWVFQQNINVRGSVGSTSTILADVAASGWDNSSSLTVFLYEGELESADDDLVLGGVNRMLVGDELIGFATAILIAPNTYTVSRLLRGLRNTPTDGHFTGERATLLDGNSVAFQELELSAIGTRRYYKALAPGQDISDAPTYAVDVSGNSLKQFPPCDVAGVRDGSDNLAITWDRRTRAIVGWLSLKPLMATREEYYLKLYDNSGNLLREVTVTGATTYIYTAADQTTDGITPGDPVVVTLAQFGDEVGPGYWSDEVTL